MSAEKNFRVSFTQEFKQKGMAKFNRMAKKLGDSYKPVITETSKWNKTSKKMEKSFTASLNKIQERFNMNALGVMFFGMQIQRTFMEIRRAGIDTYMKITEGTTEAGKAVSVFRAEMEYLKFKIGEAVSGSWFFNTVLLGMVIGLRKLSDAVPWLVSWLVNLGIVVGTVFFLFGMMNLGVGSATRFFGETLPNLKKFYNWIKNLESIKTLTENIGKLTTGLKNLYRVKVKPLLPSIGLATLWAVSLIAFLWVMTKLREKTGSWKNAFIELGYAVLQIFARIGDFLVTAIITPFQWLLTAYAKYKAYRDDTWVQPKWLTEAVEWKPTMGLEVAESWADFQAKYQNDMAMEKYNQEEQEYLESRPQETTTTTNNDSAPVTNINIAEMKVEGASDVTKWMDELKSITSG